MDAPGLKILSRKSYEAAAPSVFDNPLAARFDENDAVIYFDDVLVPWERVFVDSDIEMCQRQFHATPAHVYQNYQAMIRLSVKMRFLLGIARRIAETNGILAFPPVREMLGQLAAEAAMVDALVVAMEVKGAMHGPYYVPDRHTLYAAHVLTQQLYPKVMHTLRDLAGGGMIMQPSSYRDFENPEIARIDRYHPAVAGERRLRQGEVLQAGLGRGRLRVRLAAHAVRDVLRRCDLSSPKATRIAPTTGRARRRSSMRCSHPMTCRPRYL